MVPALPSGVVLVPCAGERSGGALQAGDGGLRDRRFSGLLPSYDGVLSTSSSVCLDRNINCFTLLSRMGQYLWLLVIKRLYGNCRTFKFRIKNPTIYGFI